MGCTCNGNQKKEMQRGISSISTTSEESRTLSVIIKYENSLYFNKFYPLSFTISSIISDFSAINKNNPIYKALTLHDLKYTDTNNELIDQSKTLKEIVPPSSKEYTIVILIHGLSGIVSNSVQYCLDNFLLAGKPFANPFMVKVYNIKTNQIHSQRFTKNVIDKNHLDLYYQNSSYCNGNNSLYISCGESNGVISGHFWRIELKSYKVDLFESITPRCFHSMIFIPNVYVFAIGGKEIKTVEYINIENKKKYLYEDIDEEMIEPSLIFVNDAFLYAVTNVNKLLIMRSNLRKKTKWEILAPKIPKSLQITQKFFGVSLGENNTLLFIGGSMNFNNGGKFIFTYDINENEITQSTIEFKSIDFSEKTFLPRDENSFFQIPNEHKGSTRIIVYNKKRNTIKHNDMYNESSINNVLRRYSKNDNFLSYQINTKQYNFNTPDSKIKEQKYTNVSPTPLDNKNQKTSNNINSNRKSKASSGMMILNPQSDLKMIAVSFGNVNGLNHPSIPLVDDTIKLSSLNKGTIFESKINLIKNSRTSHPEQPEDIVLEPK